MKQRQIPLTALNIWLAFLVGLTFAWSLYMIIHPLKIIGYDFDAFWCGGKVLLMHANPYLNQPLHACEYANSPAFFYDYPNATIPAPQPPFALAVFTIWSVIPFVLARAIWWIFLLACVFFTAKGITRLTGMPFLISLGCCGLSMTAPTIVQGALAPFAILLLTWTAVFLQEQRWQLSAYLASFAMLIPHMALPVCVAIFLGIPKARIAFLISGAICIALGLLAVGPQIFLSYFTQVLPVHAAAEVNNLGQDSLTTILYHLGVEPKLAIHLGSIQYAVFCLISIGVSLWLKKKTGETYWLALIPACFAIIGGEFIHLSEVAMAIPLAAVLAWKRQDVLSWVVLISLSIPMESLINWGVASISAALVITLILKERIPTYYIIALGVSVDLVTVWIHNIAVLEVNKISWSALGFTIPYPGDNALASVSWAASNAFATIGPLWWVEKSFTIIPLLLLMYLVFKHCKSQEKETYV